MNNCFVLPPPFPHYLHRYLFCNFRCHLIYNKNYFLSSVFCCSLYSTNQTYLESLEKFRRKIQLKYPQTSTRKTNEKPKLSYLHDVYCFKLESARKNHDVWLSKKIFLQMQKDGITPTSKMCELVSSTYLSYLLHLNSTIPLTSPEILVKNPTAYKLGIQILELYSLMVNRDIPVTAFFVRKLLFILDEVSDVELLNWVVNNPFHEELLSIQKTNLSERLRDISDPQSTTIDRDFRVSQFIQGTTDHEDPNELFLRNSTHIDDSPTTAGGTDFILKLSELDFDLRALPTPFSYISPSDQVIIISEFLIKKAEKKHSILHMLALFLFGLRIIEQNYSKFDEVSSPFLKGLANQLPASKELFLLVSSWFKSIRTKIVPSLTKLRKFIWLSYLIGICLFYQILGSIGILQGHTFSTPVPTFFEFIKFSDKFLIDRFLSISAFRGPTKFVLTASNTVDLSLYMFPLARDIGYAIYGTKIDNSPLITPKATNELKATQESLITCKTNCSFPLSHPLFEPSIHALVLSCFIRLSFIKAAIEYFQLFCSPHSFLYYDPSINALLCKALIESGEEARAIKTFQYLQLHEEKLFAALERDFSQRNYQENIYLQSPILPVLSVIFPILLKTAKMKSVVSLFCKYLLVFKPLGEKKEGNNLEHSISQLYSSTVPVCQKMSLSTISHGNSQLNPYEMNIVHSILHLKFVKVLEDEEAKFIPSDIRFLLFLVYWLRKWSSQLQFSHLFFLNNFSKILFVHLEKNRSSYLSSRNKFTLEIDPCSLVLADDISELLAFLKTLNASDKTRTPMPIAPYLWREFKFNPYNVLVVKNQKETPS